MIDIIPFVYHHPQEGLGDFILATPTIQALAEVQGKPVKTCIGSQYVRDAVEDAPFIEFIDSPIGHNIRTGGYGQYSPWSKYLPDGPRRRMPGYQFMYEVIAKNAYGHTGPRPHTYVDEETWPLNISIPDYSFAVISRGCRHSPNTDIRMRVPDDDIYRYIIMDLIDQGITPILIGDESDNDRYCRDMAKWHPQIVNLTCNDIRLLLGLIYYAKYAIVNVSGAYHCAAALRKKAFVLWQYQQSWIWLQSEPDDDLFQSSIRLEDNSPPRSNEETRTVFDKYVRDWERWNYGDNDGSIKISYRNKCHGPSNVAHLLQG